MVTIDSLLISVFILAIIIVIIFGNQYDKNVVLLLVSSLMFVGVNYYQHIKKFIIKICGENIEKCTTCSKNNGDEKETFKISEKETFDDDIPTLHKKYDYTKEIDSLFDEDGSATEPSDGDDRLREKMMDISKRAKESMFHRARFTSDNFRKYFTEELDEHADRRWWDNDSLDEFMVKDGVKWGY
jgi:hypothetical protein